MAFTPDKTTAQMFSAADSLDTSAAASVANGWTADAKILTDKAVGIRATAHLAERLDEIIRLLTP